MAFFDELTAVFDKHHVGMPPHIAQQLNALHAPSADELNAEQAARDAEKAKQAELDAAKAEVEKANTPGKAKPAKKAKTKAKVVKKAAKKVAKKQRNRN